MSYWRGQSGQARSAIGCVQAALSFICRPAEADRVDVSGGRRRTCPSYRPWPSLSCLGPRRCALATMQG
ncbi:hypothetical protein BD413DRAFT_545243 [Trametes elegans]|nr:hypothetical protein BD413DRAFT_545243 [Trametes elegans]